ncbi:hypothetical protein GCM10027598_53580 [Amycolatopsis oliviviridis]|uniref:Uncharacterized protein n=1 Tax=Amycolatopsis oliviviridis TaxID=1471590 RepID=A0ABQ3M8G4_9PSEU|nr:hypothetical protein [Amycolatopsis oliviviridis]GHH35576.1 hypothetical protein GCM10017790_77300 [Amycolatopsis oliviviridis]
MDDLDVRSALTEYVTEAEPPIGLTEDGVLAAGRRSRRRRLSAGIAGAALAVVAILGAAFMVIAPPRSDEPVAGDHCGTKTSDETEQQVRTRLSCVVSAAVRSRLAPGVRIERITIPGETPPADPFLLNFIRAGETEGAPMFYFLGVRVSDERGTGAVYVRIGPPPGYGMANCAARDLPKSDACSQRQIAEGGLIELGSQNHAGLTTHTTRLYRPSATITISTNNSGALDSGEGADLPVQRAEPTLTSAQLQEIAVNPGLVP